MFRLAWLSQVRRRARLPAGLRFAGVLLLLLGASLTVTAWPWGQALAATAQEEVLEDLKFRVEYLFWKDVAQLQLTLKCLGPGRYKAEIHGEPLGLLKLLTGPRRDSYQTEMVSRDGKLLPLIYREESHKRGKRYLKEYRFDYDQGMLELWQLKEGQGLVRKWHTTLKDPIYDPLTAFYNWRLGLLGPIREGETFKVSGIPYPNPEEIEVRIGPETTAGRKVMLGLHNNAFENDRGVIHAYLDNALVPQQAWTSARVGKINGRLDGGKSLQGGLPGLPGPR